MVLAREGTARLNARIRWAARIALELNYVKNSELVTSIFGTWPSFHDAEIVSLFLTREGANAPVLDAQIHVFAATKEIDERGFYVLKHHTLVTLRFSRVLGDIQIKFFNHQNVLVFLEIGPSESDPALLLVEMPSSYGAELSFTCSSAEVVAVDPYEPN